ncbi:synaptotagmin-7-like [Xenia sp. Carnegie-2017]|uniref:synaptotagmin-7-like n=1 Tax=Xenia sp. Carnegie-2017 TaxID=2897299 RepID=UPI001F04C72C|nr:synaptotagmin-7-like [Xenia sp. Carnegie-2017]
MNEKKTSCRKFRSTQSQDLLSILGYSQRNKLLKMASMTSDVGESKRPIVENSRLTGQSSLGEVLTSLCYNPSESLLTIKILHAKELKPLFKNRTINPFIKVRVYDDGERIYSKRTSTKYNTTSPNFLESFDVIVTKSRMANTNIVLSVYHRSNGPLHRKVMRGSILIGERFELHEYFMLDKARQHWKIITQKPYFIMEKYHPVQAIS